MTNPTLGYIHFWLTFVGVYLVFFPMHYIGIAGFPRRYYSWTNFETFSGFADLNMLVSIAAIVTLLAQFIFLFNFFYSMFRGRLAQRILGSNTSMDKPTEPGHGNWVGEIPMCTGPTITASGCERLHSPTYPYSETMSPTSHATIRRWRVLREWRNVIGEQNTYRVSEK